MTDDLLARIDELLTCYQCGGLLNGSPSLDFCGEECQRSWYAARAVALVEALPADCAPIHPNCRSFMAPALCICHRLPPNHEFVDIEALFSDDEHLSAWRDMWAQMGVVLAEYARALGEFCQRASEAFVEFGLLAKPLPHDPREHALELVRRRNTGPVQKRRAPEAIAPRRHR